MDQDLYIFSFKKKTKKTKQNKKKTRSQKKANETKEEKRISVENLTGFDDIVCKFALCTSNLLIKSSRREFLLVVHMNLMNVVYVQREKSQYLLYYNSI